MSFTAHTELHIRHYIYLYWCNSKSVFLLWYHSLRWQYFSAWTAFSHWYGSKYSLSSWALSLSVTSLITAIPFILVTYTCCGFLSCLIRVPPFATCCSCVSISVLTPLSHQTWQAWVWSDVSMWLWLCHCDSHTVSQHLYCSCRKRERHVRSSPVSLRLSSITAW